MADTEALAKQGSVIIEQIKRRGPSDIAGKTTSYRDRATGKLISKAEAALRISLEDAQEFALAQSEHIVGLSNAQAARVKLNSLLHGATARDSIGAVKIAKHLFTEEPGIDLAREALLKKKEVENKGVRVILIQPPQGILDMPEPEPEKTKPSFAEVLQITEDAPKTAFKQDVDTQRQTRPPVEPRPQEPRFIETDEGWVKNPNRK